MTKLLKSTYLRLSFIFLLILVLIGIANVLISVHYAQLNYEETNQKLNAAVAEHMVAETAPFQDGSVNQDGMNKIMSSMMAANPAIEVYLLDTEGKILSYVAPKKKIKLKTVGLAPIKKFIASDGQEFLKGEDPRHPGSFKIFSAAYVYNDGHLMGYVYIILNGDEYTSVSTSVFEKYLKRIEGSTMLIVFIGAILLALLLIWVSTRYLRTIIKTVKRFKEGDMNARIPTKSGTELNEVALAFNDMAATLVSNIDRLKVVEKMRKEMIANVSHDLRTPLAITQGYIETLLIKPDLSESERQEHLQTALRSTENLKKLVDQLFELSKLESSDIKTILR